MANSTDGNPWMIDTAAATDLLGGAEAYVRGFRWVGGTTAGHACIVKDAAGRTIWESLVSGVGNYVEADLFQVRKIKGLAVTTLASGRLYIEFV